MNHQRKLLIIQIVSELAIPLIGYFFWDWTLFFILIFYILENLFLYYFRIETLRQVKTVIFKSKVGTDYKQLLISFGFWIQEFILIHLFISTINTNLSIGHEWYNFIMYEELGIPQGIVLIPLMIFASRMKMKQDIPLILKKINHPDELKNKKISYRYSLITLGFWGMMIGFNYFFHLHDAINLIFIISLLLFRAIQKGDV